MSGGGDGSGPFALFAAAAAMRNRSASLTSTASYSQKESLVFFDGDDVDDGRRPRAAAPASAAPRVVASWATAAAAGAPPARRGVAGRSGNPMTAFDGPRSATVDAFPRGIAAAIDEAERRDVGRREPDMETVANYARPERGLSTEDRHCVMCGKTRGDGVVIPSQNKRVCRDCDRPVWRVKASGRLVKWCKGCKRFLSFAAFREKSHASKCDRCREIGRLGYARRTGRAEGPGPSVPSPGEAADGGAPGRPPPAAAAAAAPPPRRATAAAAAADAAAEAREWLDCGIVHDVRGDVKDAAGAYAKAIALDPTLADARRHLGNLELRRGRKADAFSHFAAELRLAPSHAARFARFAEGVPAIAGLLLKFGPAAARPRGRPGGALPPKKQRLPPKKRPLYARI